MRKNAVVGAIIVGVVLIAGSVTAFPKMKWWHSASDTNSDAGAGGIYATGSTQDWGIKCSHCHIDSEGLIDADFSYSPALMDIGGEPAYVPGQRYTITIDMIGEHLGETDDNTNGVNVVIEDASGNTAGDYISDSGVDSMNCPTSAPDDKDGSVNTTYVYGDCHGVIFAGLRPLTRWTFDWVAPSAGTGEVTVFYGMVDGNTEDVTSLEDDVKEGTIKILEGI